jgi:hypothetical protein
MYDIFFGSDAEDENDCISVDVELREAGWSRYRGKEAELFNKKEPEGARRGYCPSNISKRRWYGPILTPGEERDLLRKAQADDRDAKEELFRRFHRMLIDIANDYYGPSFDDRLAAATVGFMEGNRPLRSAPQ